MIMNEIMYSCMNCREEFDTFEVNHFLRKPKKIEVICPICNGYIINPKGQSLIKGECYGVE